MIVLETKRLLLRRLVMTDLDHLHALYRDPEMRRHFPEGTLDYDETREELEWFLEGHPDHPELGLWATLSKDTGEFIGRNGLLPWTIEGSEEVEIAYMIARPYWGQGLGSEVARALVRHGFERLGLPRLIALIDPDHRESIHTAQSAGLAFDREIRVSGTRTAVYSIRNPNAAA